MTLMNFLNIGAVPFAYPEEDKSLVARRYRSKQLKKHFQKSHMKQQEQQHLLMTTVVNEAVDTLNNVVGSSRNRDTSPDDRVKTDRLRAPPNSPNDKMTFDFPDLVHPSNVLLPDQPQEEQDEQEQLEEVESPVVIPCRAVRMRRSQRKRRRIPSFKTKQNPRVPSKMSTCSDEADDEASEDDDDLVLNMISSMTTNNNNNNNIKTFPRANSIDNKGKNFSSSDSDTEEELELKLKVLSEVQRTLSSEDEDSTKSLRYTDWSKVGQELRNIADKFSESQVDEVDGNDGATVVDFVSMANMMLPFSIPQSLWSALVSYAAWKILKRFQ